MPQRTAMIGGLLEVFGMVRAMPADGPDLRRAPAGMIRGGMAEDVDRRPGSRGGCGGCEPGDIGPAVPWIRRHRRARELSAARILPSPCPQVPGPRIGRMGRHSNPSALSGLPAQCVSGSPPNRMPRRRLPRGRSGRNSRASGRPAGCASAAGLQEPYPRSSAPVAFRAAATTLSATAAISPSVSVASVG